PANHLSRRRPPPPHASSRLGAVAPGRHGRGPAAPHRARKPAAPDRTRHAHSAAVGARSGASLSRCQSIDDSRANNTDARQLRARTAAGKCPTARRALAALARLDGRGNRLKKLLPALAAATAMMATASAAAQPTHDYYTAHASRSAAPRQLDQQAHDYYAAVFAAIDRQDWAGAQSLLAQRGDGLLHPVAVAELYLAANSPRVELYQIEAWLTRGRNLPQAAQLGRLGLTRGAAQMPDLPSARPFHSTGSVPKRTRPRSVTDGTMPNQIASAIQERITNDDPDGARLLLDGIDASLSAEARAEWRQKVAWSYYIEHRDPEALAQAATVAQGSGAWVAEGDWTMGLAAWRLGDCAQSGAAFERAAYGAQNPELRSAAYYWAGRAALRCREPERSNTLFRNAASADQTLYGMLAAEQLGVVLPERVAGAEFSDADWRRVGRHENVRIAIALAEIGRDELSSEVLLHQARIGDPSDYAA